MPIIADAPTHDTDPYAPGAGDWRHETARAVTDVRPHKFFPSAVCTVSQVRGCALHLSGSVQFPHPRREA